MYLLIAKSLNREASPAEQQELDTWLQADEANRKLFHEMKLLWTGANELLAQPEFDTTAAWDKVAAATIGNPATDAFTPKVKPFRKWLALGGAVAAILAVVFIVRFYNGEDIITATADGNALAVELPDHTKVRLEAGSSLSYPEQFSNDQRAVTLKGKAFFDVTRNERQPFVIDASSVQVQVLGTSFYVTTDSSAATVAVTEGKVRMQVKGSNSKGAQVILTPGQKGIYQHDLLNSVADTNSRYYTTGELHLNDRALSAAVDVLSNVSNTKIIIDAGLSSAKKEQLINISFRNQSLEKMLDELCLISNTRWKMEKDQYVVYSR